jgi:hypothetical protein
VFDVIDQESVETEHVRVPITDQIEREDLRVLAAVVAQLATGSAGPEFGEDNAVIRHGSRVQASGRCDLLLSLSSEIFLTMFLLVTANRTHVGDE